MALHEELERIAGLAARYAAPGERLSAVLAAEPPSTGRGYLCCYENGSGRCWLVVDPDGRAVEDRTAVREVASLAAMCELAAEVAGGGDLDRLRQELVTLRLTENPPGIDEAEEAIGRLGAAIGTPPRLATAGYLDDVGAAARGLERALGEPGASSPFATAMQAGAGVVDELAADVLGSYKTALRDPRG